jgi:hypothetical protein
VFHAHAEAELVEQMQIKPWDIRIGGGYRYVLENDHGKFGFNGVLHKVRDNEFSIQTAEFEGAPDMVNVEFSGSRISAPVAPG